MKPRQGKPSQERWSLESAGWALGRLVVELEKLIAADPTAADPTVEIPVKDLVGLLSWLAEVIESIPAKRPRGRPPKLPTLGEMMMGPRGVGRPRRLTTAAAADWVDVLEQMRAYFNVGTDKAAIERTNAAIAKEEGRRISTALNKRHQKFYSKARKIAGKPLRRRNPQNSKK